MEKKDNSNFNQLAMVFLAGAAVGAIIGVLFAPAKGKETRDHLSHAFKDLSGDLKEKFTGDASKSSENQS